MIPPLCSRSSDSVHEAQPLDLVGERVGEGLELLVRLRDPVRAHLALDPPDDVVGQHADRADRVAEVHLAELAEPLAHGLHRREGDERAHHVVGALEDREDARVAQRLLVGLVAHVAGAALELERAVGLVPEELGAGDLHDRRLERVVGHAPVDQAAGQVGHRLEPEEVGDHPADLVLHQLEVRRAAGRTACAPSRGRSSWSSRIFAPPTDPVPRLMRPLFRMCMAILKPSPGSPSTFSGGHAHVVVVELAQVVAAQAHRVEALADLEPLHALLEDEGGVAPLAVDLGGGEGHEHRALVAVADVVLRRR